MREQRHDPAQAPSDDLHRPAARVLGGRGPDRRRDHVLDPVLEPELAVGSTRSRRTRAGTSGGPRRTRCSASEQDRGAGRSRSRAPPAAVRAGPARGGAGERRPRARSGRGCAAGRGRSPSRASAAGRRARRRAWRRRGSPRPSRRRPVRGARAGLEVRWEREQQLEQLLGRLELRAASAALDQLHARGGQRVEHARVRRCAGPSGRACPTRASPGRRRRRGRTAPSPARAADRGRSRAARPRARVEPLSPENASATARCAASGLEDRVLAVGAADQRAYEGDRDRDRDVEQPANDRVALDQVEPAGQVHPRRRHRDDAGQRQLAGLLAEPQRHAAAERVAGDHDLLAAARSPAPSAVAKSSSCGRIAPRRRRAAWPKPGRSTAIARRPQNPSSVSSGRHVSAESPQPCRSTIPGPWPSSSSTRVRLPASSIECSAKSST